MGKVILAYSGGLETTAAIHWLTNRRHKKVTAMALNLGTERDLDDIAERALSAGAVNCHVIDVRRNFVKNFCFKALKAGAKYEGKYLLSAALSRPLIATELVRLAHDEGANGVAHGAPPMGNDQFRIEASVTALDPHLNVMAPLREWRMKTRDEVLEYADRYNLEIDKGSGSGFTRDKNLWGARCAGGDLSDINSPVDERAHVLTVNPLEAPDEPESIVVTFNKGEPQKIDGKRLDPIQIMEVLNEIGARHGVGRLDFIEHSKMGFKKREVYEAPGATILHSAHDAMERFVLDKATLNLKRTLADHYAEAIYSGLWFSTLRESLDAFVQISQEYVTGDVTMQIYKGSVSAVSGQSEYSTYDRELLSLADTGGAVPVAAAEGMLSIARLQQLTRAFKQKPRT